MRKGKLTCEYFRLRLVNYPKAHRLSSYAHHSSLITHYSQLVRAVSRISRISIWQEPHPVPARQISPISSTVRAAPEAAAFSIVSSDTPKHVQINAVSPFHSAACAFL